MIGILNYLVGLDTSTQVGHRPGLAAEAARTAPPRGWLCSWLYHRGRSCPTVILKYGTGV